MFQEKVIKQAAETFYDKRLPYHNFGHIHYVLSSAEKLLARCEKEQVIVNEEVVYYALLFHDAGYQEDHNSKGFDTKEAYSADIAGRVLQEYDVEDNIINKAKQSILCTHFSVHCTSNEDKAVKASDLSGLAGDYDFFKGNAVNLMHEQKVLSGKEVVWDRWKVTAAEKLELYLEEDFSLTSDNTGNRVFLDSARANIQRMLQDNLE